MNTRIFRLLAGAFALKKGRGKAVWGSRAGRWRGAIARGVALLKAATLAAIVLAPSGGVAATYFHRTLYAFCSQNNCIDGASPWAAPIVDAAGNLYGTTVNGGTFGGGVVYELTPVQNGWTEGVLYAFCSQQFSCGDGAEPYGGLIMDDAGNLYGTTTYGTTVPNAVGGGVVFKLTPPQFIPAWTYEKLFAFGPGDDLDGSGPTAGLTMDGAGNLYGTTLGGGTFLGGVVFELLSNHAGAFAETVLYDFCSQSNCVDGAGPEYSSVIMDNAGNLYGTTEYGGNTSSSLCNSGSPVELYEMGCGVVFKLTPHPAGGWTETVLHVFCSQVAQGNCADGAFPFAGLTMDEAGNLYGTTTEGGSNGEGTVFELSPNAAGGWVETVLHNFCSQNNVGNLCTDGLGPYGGLIMDNAGNLYGTTVNGGTFGGGGVIFKLTPNPNGGAWTYSILYSFPSHAAGDASNPIGLTMDSAGNLFGTTVYGPATISCALRLSDCGTVFELIPSVPPSQVETTASGLAYSRLSQTFNGTVTITNISGSPIKGPFSILFNGLTPGVTLANATGVTLANDTDDLVSGWPYLTIAKGGLAPGQSVTVAMRFKDPLNARINFVPTVYSGSL